MNAKQVLKDDFARYPNRKPPLYPKLLTKYLRKAHFAKQPIIKLFYKIALKITSSKNGLEISSNILIGGGLYLGHPYNITINENVIIGNNCNIHKGVTIGQENRGKRRGTPVIGNMVWIGVNSTIVGKFTIGDDVLIAPNTFVNCDVPDHSIVFGNPCVIKYRVNATGNYINNAIKY